MHQHLARLSGSSLCIVDIQVNYGGGNWVYDLHLGCEVQQGYIFLFYVRQTRHCLSLQPLEQYLVHEFRVVSGIVGSTALMARAVFTYRH